jgi:hypothetical protein
VATVQAIEAVLPNLSRAEIEEVRAGIDAFLAALFELSEVLKAQPSQKQNGMAW